MTLTASPGSSAAVDHAAFGDVVASAETVFTTTDHRRVGGLMVGVAMFLAVDALALLAIVTFKMDSLLRGALPGSGLMSANPSAAWSFERLFNAQRQALPIFVVAPLFIALATLTVPRLIGSKRMAFPRLQALVLWTYVLSVGLLIAAYAVGDGPPTLTVFNPSPLSGPLNHANGLLIGAFAVVTTAMVLGSINIVATVLTQRQPGLRVGEVAPFAWASTVFSAVTILSGPVFLAGLLLTYVDRRYQTDLAGGVGFDRVWAHQMFFFGRPDGLLLLVPTLGIASQIVAQRAGKPLLGGPAANVLLSAAGIATLFTWATQANITRAMTQPTPAIVSALIAAPAGLLVLVWLGTLAKGVKPDASLLVVVTPIVIGGLAAINAIVAGAKGVVSDLELPWSVGQSTALIVALPLAVALGGLLAFAPTIWGRATAAPLSGLAGLAGLGGGLLILVGHAGLAYKESPTSNATALAVIAAIGAVLLLGAVLLTGLNLMTSILGKKGALIDPTGASLDTAAEVVA